jgi:hypothetical protein
MVDAVELGAALDPEEKIGHGAFLLSRASLPIANRFAGFRSRISTFEGENRCFSGPKDKTLRSIRLQATVAQMKIRSFVHSERL